MKKRERIIKTRFFKPYNKNGTTNILFALNRSGVYLIKKGDNVVYIGYSGTNLYKTCLRHFQIWNDHRQVRVFYTDLSDITVRIVLCSPARAEKLERALIIRHRPKNNPDKLKLYVPTAMETELLNEYNTIDTTNLDDIEVPF